MAILLLSGCVQTERFAREPCPFLPQHPCEDRILKEEAEAVAREAGLGPGIGRWSTDFGWHHDSTRPQGGFHVWTVHNTTVQGSGATRTSGTAAIVDSDTGRFVAMIPWSG